jgi:hypothetical protein
MMRGDGVGVYATCYGRVDADALSMSTLFDGLQYGRGVFLKYSEWSISSFQITPLQI